MNQLPPQLDPLPRGFTQLLSSTRRGARLARLLTAAALRSWDAPKDLTERAELVVAELAANAVAHGHVPGRDFRVTLHFDPAAGLLRAEVTDARGERRPRFPQLPCADGADGAPHELSTGGYGLALVTALADRWETVPHPPSGKTVRAVLTSPAPGHHATNPTHPHAPFKHQGEIAPRLAAAPKAR